MVHKQAFRVAFDYLNAHFPPGDTPEWWTKAAQEATDLSKKYHSYPLVNGLLVGVMEYLEKEHQIRRKKDESIDNPG